MLRAKRSSWFSSRRLSTMPNGQATTLQSATQVPMWLAAYAT